MGVEIDACNRNFDVPDEVISNPVWADRRVCESMRSQLPCSEQGSQPWTASATSAAASSIIRKDDKPETIQGPSGMFTMSRPLPWRITTARPRVSCFTVDGTQEISAITAQLLSMRWRRNQWLCLKPAAELHRNAGRRQNFSTALCLSGGEAGEARCHHRGNRPQRSTSYILSQGAKPSFLGYGGFPGSACISVNDEVIHGIPGSRVIRRRATSSALDVGAYIQRVSWR